MLKEIKDDVFYVCTMIEFVARATHNKVGDVIKVRIIDVDIKRKRIGLTMKGVAQK